MYRNIQPKDRFLSKFGIEMAYILLLFVITLINRIIKYIFLLFFHSNHFLQTVRFFQRGCSAFFRMFFYNNYIPDTGKSSFLHAQFPELTLLLFYLNILKMKDRFYSL